MTPEQIDDTLKELFGAAAQLRAPGSWQVDTDNLRILVLLSNDTSWLRILVPIAPAPEALPFAQQLLEANFDDTQETRYALHQDVLWGVYHHPRETITKSDLSAALARLLSLHEKGISEFFNQMIEARIRTIIKVAKQQGQSMSGTLQTLDRLYAEGILGEMNEGPESREQVLAAWRRQLERLWPEVQP